MRGSGATRRSMRSESQQCSALRDLDAIKHTVIRVYAHWPLKDAVCAPPQDRAGHQAEQAAQIFGVLGSGSQLYLIRALPEDGSVS